MCLRDQVINIDADQYADLSRLFYKRANSKVARSPEIANQGIEKMDISMLEDALNFLEEGIFIFVGKEFSRHAGVNMWWW